jgi:hypothetical protein
LKGRLLNYIAVFLPIEIQLAFGNLFSAFVIFYVRGGSVFTSWPFLLPLFVLFLGNDFFRKRYLNLTFQMSLFFISLFSYAILVFPLLFGKIGDLIFIASGLVSLALFLLFILIFRRAIPERLELNFRPLFFSISGIFILFQVLYFTNSIPPAPLTMKESGVYHSLQRIYDNKNYIYKVTVEPAKPYLFFEDQSNTVHVVPGETIYVYSSVFSPTKLDIPIYHRWSYFDEKKKEWVEKARLSFSIIGGLNKGYRGYSYMSNLAEGKWRVDVITEQDKILGRRSFDVIKVSIEPELKTIFR